jgi:hypothetical protein
MPGDSGVTVVTVVTGVVCFFCPPGCGCIGRPAFPTPFGAEEIFKARAITPREREGVSPTVIAREGGRSSIPETLMIEPKSRGLLDAPLEPVIGLAEGETRWRSMTA